ncbi:NHL domain-containing protein [Streptomyces sp. 900105245]
MIDTVSAIYSGGQLGTAGGECAVDASSAVRRAISEREIAVATPQMVPYEVWKIIASYLTEEDKVNLATSTPWLFRLMEDPTAWESEFARMSPSEFRSHPALRPLWAIRARPYVTVFAGTGEKGSGGEGGQADAAQFTFPYGVAVNGNGEIYVSDMATHTVWKIDRREVLTRVTGTVNVAGRSRDGEPTNTALLKGPAGLAVYTKGDGSDVLYIADSGNDRVVIVEDGRVGTLVPNLKSPMDVAVNLNGVLYAASTWDNVVIKVGRGQAITIVAGTPGINNFSGDGGQARAAEIQAPFAVTVDRDGAVYIGTGARIRRVDEDGIIDTIAGTGLYGDDDNDGAAAVGHRISYPMGLAVDDRDANRKKVYFTDMSNGRLRCIDQGALTTVIGALPPNDLYNFFSQGDDHGELIGTLAPKGTQGAPGGTEAAQQARLGAPRGLAMGPGPGGQYLCFADTLNYVIRRIGI